MSLLVKMLVWMNKGQKKFLIDVANRLEDYTRCVVQMNPEKYTWDVLLPDDSEISFSMDELYQRYLASGKNKTQLEEQIALRAEVVMKRVREINQALGKTNQAQPTVVSPGNVLPGIRNVDYLQRSMATVAKYRLSEADHLCYQDFLGDAYISYVNDQGSARLDLYKRHLKTLQVQDIAGLHRLARHNFQNYVAKTGMQVRASKSQNSVRQISVDSTYDASLLLLMRDIAPQLPPMQGFPVVAIPASDVFLVCDSEDTGGLQELRELVQLTWAEGMHSVSKELFCFYEGKIRLFRLQ